MLIDNPGAELSETMLKRGGLVMSLNVFSSFVSTVYLTGEIGW